MSLTKLSLGWNNLFMTSLFPARESLVSDIAAGDGNIVKLFNGVVMTIDPSFLSFPALSAGAYTTTLLVMEAVVS